MSGEIAVVTGAAGGIGRAVAVKLAAEGANVALIDVTTDALTGAAGEVAGRGVRSLAITADCGDRHAIQAAFDRVKSELGVPTILVNNVGLASKGGVFGQTDFAELERLLDLNLKAAMFCSREVVDGMKSVGHGKIVNVASDAAMIGDLGSWGYAAAKAGLIGFTRSLARELASSKINVNAVAPGYTRTAMTAQISEESRQRILSMVPMGEVIEPEDIAEAIAFLASDRSRFITGQTLPVNGGRWMI